jgi:cell division initiation protein
MDGARYPGFSIRFRGFDRMEVVAALAKLASENEEARREMDRLASEIDRLQATVAEQLGSERHVQRALVSASKVADDIRDRAEEEARRIVREAEDRAEGASQRLRDQARNLEGQIDALLARRREVEASIESFIKVISDELEHVRQNDAGDASRPANGALNQLPASSFQFPAVG